KLVKVTNKVQAFVKDSSIDAAGNLSLTATDAESINAVVVAASAAASGGLVGVSLSGAGGNATNQIASQVGAYIDGDGATGIFASNLTLQAQDNSIITAAVDAVSVALAIAPFGGSVSVSVALASNSIGNAIESYITNASHDVQARTGNIDLNAQETATIN